MKRILILDFDGTIIDSNYVKENAIIEYIRNKYQLNILNIVDKYKFKNLTRYELINLIKNSPLTLEERGDIDRLIDTRVIKSRLDPYIFNLFNYFSKFKIKIYLVSNTPNDSLNFIIDKLKISHYFYRIIGKKNWYQ